MFIHCNRKFKPHESWFLIDNENFTERKLNLGTCPICYKGLAELIETRITDNAIFRDVITGKRLEQLIPLLIKQVNYTSEDVKKYKNALFGLCYGENQEIKNSKGEVIEIRQKRCDFFGGKQTILTIKTK